jgi:hypothetical protein
MTIDLDHAYVDGRRGLNPRDFIVPQDPRVQAIAGQIVEKLGGQDTPAARLREAYNYVTLNVRYVADMTQFGYEEVWQMPDSTLKRGIGDCEDLSFLLCSLLRALGIRAGVTFGTFKGVGHAWVEAYVDGSGGVLESTSGQPFAGFADSSGYAVEEAYAAEASGLAPGDPLAALLVYALPGLALLGVGAFLMIDDAHDAFKMELSTSTCEGQPGKHGMLKGVTIPGLGPHIHHWWIGLILVIIAIMLIAIGVVMWMLKYL